MIHIIMGLKGSGKTKRMIDSINEAVAGAQGDVVCIEYGKQLTYDINYRVRLVNSKEYGINNIDKLKGLLYSNFISLHAILQDPITLVGKNISRFPALLQKGCLETPLSYRRHALAERTLPASRWLLHPQYG